VEELPIADQMLTMLMFRKVSTHDTIRPLFYGGVKKLILVLLVLWFRRELKFFQSSSIDENMVGDFFESCLTPLGCNIIEDKNGDWEVLQKYLVLNSTIIKGDSYRIFFI
jgi:hypothetical protein